MTEIQQPKLFWCIWNGGFFVNEKNKVLLEKHEGIKPEDFLDLESEAYKQIVADRKAAAEAAEVPLEEVDELLKELMNHAIVLDLEVTEKKTKIESYHSRRLRS